MIEIGQTDKKNSIKSNGNGSFVFFLFFLNHGFGDNFLLAEKVLVPIDKSFLKIIFKLDVALFPILLIVIVHDRVILLSEFELLKVLFDDMLVLFCELYEFFGIVDFENVEPGDHFLGPDLVMLFRQKLRNDCLVIGANGNNVRMLMHINWLVLLCHSQFFF